jgi:outer membrane protein assembly factor BamB
MKPFFLPLLLPLLLTGCGTMGWFGGDDVDAPAELEDLVSQFPIKTLWSVSVGDGTDEQLVRLVPFVDRDRVYAAAYDGEVRAFDAHSGKLLWSNDTDLKISGGPGVGEGVVLLGTGDAELVVLDADTGAEKWRARLSSEALSVPGAGNGVAVVHTLDGKLFGFDVEDGEQLWVYDRATPILTLYGSSSPVISGDSVICGFASGKLAALDLDSGGVRWEVSVSTPSGRTELERMVDIDGDPLLVDDTLYVTSYQGDLAAVSVETGVVLWRRKLSSYVGAGGDWRQIYSVDTQGKVWAIDQRNSSAVWQNDKLLHRRLSAPAVLGDYVLVGDFEGYLHWLAREDGRIVARVRVGSDPISATPVVIDEVVYVYGDGGRLQALTPVLPGAS